MTKEHRILHAKVFDALRYILPGLLLVGLLGYRIPVYSELPKELLHALPDGAELEHEEEAEFENNVRLRVEVFKVPSPTAPGIHNRWVRVTAPPTLRQPDLLLYWSSKSSTYEEPPLGSIMLGELDPRTPAAFPLPPQAQFLRGYLVIYSVGQRVLITQVQLPQPF